MSDILLKSVIFLFTISLFSQLLAYTVLNKHSYPLPNGEFQIKSAYLKVNDTIDIFNMKEQELGSSKSSLGSMGDMTGYDFEVRYGITQNDSIFINYQKWSIAYGESMLENNKLDLFNRFNIYEDDSSFFSSFSIDIGYEGNRASPIDIKDDVFLNSMIKKIKPNTSMVFKDGSIISDDTTLSLYNIDGNKIYPYISIADLQSDSYYARLLLGKEITQNLFLDFYIGYKLVDIKTEIQFFPNDVTIINNLMSNFEIPNMDRKESVMSLGFSSSLNIYSFIAEINYEYNKIFRDADVSNIDINHKIDASISRKIDDNFLVYLGGTLMLNQFNTDLPYLYTQYTKTQFDKKYGYVQIGLVYQFKGF